MSTETAPANGNDIANPTNSNGIISNPAVHKAALPYQSVGDFLSNVNNFKIIESTLREGEQFANAYFDTGMFICLPCAA